MSPTDIILLVIVFELGMAIGLLNVLTNQGRKW